MTTVGPRAQSGRYTAWVWQHAWQEQSVGINVAVAIIADILFICVAMLQLQAKISSRPDALQTTDIRTVQCTVVMYRIDGLY